MFEMNLSYNLCQFFFFTQKAKENTVFTKLVVQGLIIKLDKLISVEFKTSYFSLFLVYLI